jgi:hypothetical protein
MTRKELENRAWRLIGMAKIASDRSRRKMLMQEAFDLATRASALRELDLDSVGVKWRLLDWRAWLSDAPIQRGRHYTLGLLTSRVPGRCDAGRQCFVERVLGLLRGLRPVGQHEPPAER